MDLFPGRVRMIIHEPVPVEGYTMKNIEELSSRVRAVIQRDLDAQAA